MCLSWQGIQQQQLKQLQICGHIFFIRIAQGQDGDPEAVALEFPLQRGHQQTRVSGQRAQRVVRNGMVHGTARALPVAADHAHDLEAGIGVM